MLKSVYKTYLDIIYIRKDVGNRMRNIVGIEDDEVVKYFFVECVLKLVSN